ncbi:hypothetical protein RUR49_12920 [Pseudoxanthobacter sp. M-2]
MDELVFEGLSEEGCTMAFARTLSVTGVLISWRAAGAAPFAAAQ